jgi:exodeoxyribonuclease V alpha subunit
LRIGLQAAEEAGTVLVEELDGERIVGLAELLRAEERVATRLRTQVPAKVRVEAKLQPDLSEEQNAALRRAFESPVSVICGAPGRGKSRVAAAIARAACELGWKAGLLAPTGRAAARLQEHAGALDLECGPATIHRGLLGSAALGRGPGVLVIDESSMIDVELAANVLARVPESWHLVLVGDPNQLASIGAGRFFGDLIESGRVPVTRLTRNWRQGQSGLADAIDAVLEGRVPESDSEEFRREELARRTPARAIHLILERTAVELGLEPTEIPVITPRRTGEGLECDARRLNEHLRRHFNPRAQGRPFGVGDPVIQIRNDYELAVFNGERGRVVSEKDGQVRVRYEGRDVAYGPEQTAAGLQLAYAATIHKYQGTEAEAVVVVLHREAGSFVDRRMIYTAISRARQRCIVLETPGALERAIENTREDRRRTTLGRRLARGEA